VKSKEKKPKQKSIQHLPEVFSAKNSNAYEFSKSLSL